MGEYRMLAPVMSTLPTRRRSCVACPNPSRHRRGPHMRAAFSTTPMKRWSTRARRFDMRTLISRRGVLSLVGLGVGTAALAACAPSTTGANPTATPSPTPTATPSASASATTPAIAVPAGEIPDETAGPYPGDGSNGPDILEQSGIVRSDIRSQPRRRSNRRGRADDPEPHDPRCRERRCAVPERRRLRLALRRAREATRCTRRVSRTRPTCAGSRSRTPTVWSRSSRSSPPATRGGGRISTSRSIRLWMRSRIRPRDRHLPGGPARRRQQHRVRPVGVPRVERQPVAA